MRNENDNRKIERIVTFGNVLLVILLSFIASLVVIAVAYHFVPRLDTPPSFTRPPSDEFGWSANTPLQKHCQGQRNTLTAAQSRRYIETHVRHKHR